ncbi:MAG TPA: helix-turn-helix domain-containing protein [Mycobacteriales bacterium]|nr:helix-turn-helix domain-containing protein [Mycobacteriales bacterium]
MADDATETELPSPVPGGDGNGELDLGARLRWLRRSVGLSQRDMARRLHLSAHSSIGYYETGRRIPPEDIVAAYERVLGLPEGELLRHRLRALAARAAATAHAGQTEPATDAGPVPGGAGSPVARGRRRPRPVSAATLAAAAVGVAVLLSTSASAPPARTDPAASAASTRTGLDPTWSQPTQHVTDKAIPASSPEPMDGDDPRARDCVADAVVVQAVPLDLPGGARFGTLRLRHSRHCAASWGSAYYRNPHLYTIRITVHRPADGAIVRDDWSNNTPPGSYSDVLSTGTGCVWVEAVVITPTGTSPHARTTCAH